MMLERLGEHERGKAITTAIAKLLAEGAARTRDPGGQAGTPYVGRAIAEAVAKA